MPIFRGLMTLSLAVLVQAAAHAAPVGQRVSLTYDFYAAALPVARLDTTVELTGGAYRVASDLQTVGLADARIGWRADQLSQGRMVDGTARPTRHENRGVWRKQRRSVSIAYAAAGPVELSLEPAAEADRHPPVAAAERAGTVDFMSAMVQVAFAESPAAGCSGTKAVFDGRRRYDMVLRPAAEDELPARRHRAYSGPALRCAVEVVRIAGFADAEDGLEMPRQLHVWLAREATSGLVLPVQLQAKTAFGTAIVFLARVAAEDFRQARLSD